MKKFSIVLLVALGVLISNSMAVNFGGASFTNNIARSDDGSNAIVTISPGFGQFVVESSTNLVDWVTVGSYGGGSTLPTNYAVSPTPSVYYRTWMGTLPIATTPVVTNTATTLSSNPIMLGQNREYYGVHFTYTITNGTPQDLYLSKYTLTLMQLSVSSSAVFVPIGTTSSTVSGDTTNYFVMPAFTGRNFDSNGRIMNNAGDWGQTFSVVPIAIRYGISPTGNLEESSVPYFGTPATGVFFIP